jgi:hypothetical protein
MVYVFVCDPEDCDAMIKVYVSDLHDFPSGEIKMTCPCGRSMHYIGLDDTNA